MAHPRVVFNTGRYCPFTPIREHQGDWMLGSHPYLDQLLMLIRQTHHSVFMQFNLSVFSTHNDEKELDSGNGISRSLGSR